MLSCQKSLFDLEKDHTYLNCAYMSPQLNSATGIGIQSLRRKSRPYQIVVQDFYDPVNELKVNFSRLINNKEKERIAIIPAVSYGIANVAKNVKIGNGDNIVMVEEQFPSNYYSWKRLVDENNASLKIVKVESSINDKILEAIDEQTKVVALAHVHWADGRLFDLKAIRKKSREVGALLVIDGTQSVGALPFDVQEIEPDALICGGYKWLLGPYSLSVAYYGPALDEGIPIEENWINRKDSYDFKNLVNYQPEYQPKAGRYSMGEQSNFVLVPMLNAAIQQLLEWGPENIQSYCAELWKPVIQEFKDLGCHLENSEGRGEHLVGIGLDQTFDRQKLNEVLKENRVYVSLRGNSIRVSPHLYNEAKDMGLLLSCFKRAKELSSTSAFG